MTAGFQRLWRAPKRAFKGGTLWTLNPQGRYLYDRSRARFEQRDDAYRPSTTLLTGELGTINNVRFITSAALT